MHESPDDIDRLITDMLGFRPNLSRKQRYQMFVELFPGPHLRKRREACAQAILDMVGSTVR